MNVKGILLDIDNTLYDYNKAHKVALDNVLDSLVDKYSLDRIMLDQAYEKARLEVHIALSETASSHNRILYFQRMFEHLNMNALKHALNAYNVYWDIFLENMEFHEGVYEFLELVRGKRVCLVSDLTANIQHRKIQKMKLFNHIDLLVTSEEAGKEKPHPYIFMLALKKICLNPSKVCMIGDSYEKDITGAVNLGIRSLWLNKMKEKKKSNPLITEFGSFTELIRIIQS